MEHYFKMFDLMYFLLSPRYLFLVYYILYLGVEYEIHMIIKNSIYSTFMVY